ncbi:hypothetical protein HDU76_002842 [Blyttiomyces sp. JEL0837]|nr:hypothetical protein HDU76_002842 [Blyttiomyces sp. JEL0837]
MDRHKHPASTAPPTTPNPNVNTPSDQKGVLARTETFYHDPSARPENATSSSPRVKDTSNDEDNDNEEPFVDASVSELDLTAGYEKTDEANVNKMATTTGTNIHRDQRDKSSLTPANVESKTIRIIIDHKNPPQKEQQFHEPQYSALTPHFNIPETTSTVVHQRHSAVSNTANPNETIIVLDLDNINNTVNLDETYEDINDEEDIISRPSVESPQECKDRRKREAMAKIRKHIKGGTTRTFKVVAGVVTDFWEFIAQGKVFELAVGLVIGSAFTTVIASVVNDLFSPIIGLALGSQLENVFVYLKHPDPQLCERNATMCEDIKTPAQAHAVGGVTWNIGLFIQSLFNFFMVALILFLIIRLSAAFRATHHGIIKLQERNRRSISSKYSGKTTSHGAGHRPNVTSTSLDSVSTSTLVAQQQHQQQQHDHQAMVKLNENTERNRNSNVVVNVDEFTGTGRPSVGGIAEKSPGSETITITPPTINSPTPAPSNYQHQHQFADTRKQCPYCYFQIPKQAIRCGFCRSDLHLIQEQQLQQPHESHGTGAGGGGGDTSPIEKRKGKKKKEKLVMEVNRPDVRLDLPGM